MFLGQYQHSVDSKGRIIIPNEFRKELSATLYLTRGLENCIFVFNQDVWEKLYQGIASLPLTRKEGRSFSRVFLANASSTNLDSQGRIMLPRSLRDYAHIEKNSMIVGVGTRVEIWSEDVWKSYSDDVQEKFEEITEGIIDSGI